MIMKNKKRYVQLSDPQKNQGTDIVTFLRNPRQEDMEERAGHPGASFMFIEEFLQRFINGRVQRR